MRQHQRPSNPPSEQARFEWAALHWSGMNIHLWRNALLVIKETNIHTHTHIYSGKVQFMFIHISPHTREHTHADVYIYSTLVTCAQASHIHAHTHTQYMHMYKHICTKMNTDTPINMLKCTNAYTHSALLQTYTCTNTRTNTHAHTH